jgi:uncharacterized protein YjbI with pentapeptide repeats
MSSRDYGAEYEYQPGARCNIKQFRTLMNCRTEEDVMEWNDRRRGRPDEEVWLCGVDLAKASLNKINLGSAHLEGSVLAGAKLAGAILGGACLDGAVLWQAHLEGANLWQASLRGTKLWRARMRGAALIHADLENAFLREADLTDADFSNAGLEGAVLAHTKLQGTKLNNARLQGADLQFALIDGATRIAECEVDRDTDFTGVGLDAGRVEPGLTQLLMYNIRRKRWIEWYRQGPKWLQWLKWSFIAPFWWMSNYGQSMGRMLVVFMSLALGFAGIYYCFPHWLDGLNTSGGAGSAIHALYFSVVTMTTLGFGDIHARADVWQGQVLLMVQVIFGYILLGALITRLAVLFTAGGPAAHFSKRKSRDDK